MTTWVYLYKYNNDFNSLKKCLQKNTYTERRDNFLAEIVWEYLSVVYIAYVYGVWLQSIIS